MSIFNQLSRAFSRTGYDIRRTDAKRRAELFRHANIDLVLDVGAATGQYAAEIRRHGYDGTIISFEPLNDAYASLERQAASDPNWVTIRTAVGAASETGWINIAGNSDSSSILPMLSRHEDVAPHTRYVGSQAIEIRPLDQLVLSDVQSAKNALLKIDTQGFERSVLDGAAEVMKLLRGVQIELSFVPLYDGAMKFDEAIERLLGEGFDLHLIEPGFRDPDSQQLLQADGVFLRDNNWGPPSS